MLLFRYKWTGRLISQNEANGHTAFPNKNPRGKRNLPYMIKVYKTKAFKEFMNSFVPALKELNYQIDGYIDIVLSMSMKTIRDTDNPLKAVCDAIEASGLVKNDRFIRNETLQRGYHKNEFLDFVELEIFRADHTKSVWTQDKEEYAYIDYDFRKEQSEQ